MRDRDVHPYARIAYELAARMRRDRDLPDAYGMWLDEQLLTLPRVAPTRLDYRTLCFVLAAAIPDDVAWLDLTSWTCRDRQAPAEPVHAQRRRILLDAGRPPAGAQVVDGAA